MEHDNDVRPEISKKDRSRQGYTDDKIPLVDYRKLDAQRWGT